MVFIMTMSGSAKTPIKSDSAASTPTGRVIIHRLGLTMRPSSPTTVSCSGTRLSSGRAFQNTSFQILTME